MQFWVDKVMPLTLHLARTDTIETQNQYKDGHRKSGIGTIKSLAAMTLSYGGLMIDTLSPSSVMDTSVLSRVFEYLPTRAWIRWRHRHTHYHTPSPPHNQSNTTQALVAGVRSSLVFSRFLPVPSPSRSPQTPRCP